MATSALELAAAAASREHALFARASGYNSGVPETPDKLSAIRAAVEVFSERNVAYALIGGLAVGIRSGLPRATLDVDFAVPTNADKAHLISTFTSRGFRLVGEFAHSINFRHDSGEPVQLAFDVSFDEMIGRAEKLQLGDFQLVVVTKSDLIEMKRRAAMDPRRRRSKALRDQADVALLEGDVPEPDEGW
jgi:hypothetical protein